MPHRTSASRPPATDTVIDIDVVATNACGDQIAGLPIRRLTPGRNLAYSINFVADASRCLATFLADQKGSHR